MDRESHDTAKFKNKISLKKRALRPTCLPPLHRAEKTGLV
jgi:hypothetical protein